MKKLGQRGFSAVEGVLIFVIVALVGGVGYYVYVQKNSDENTKPTNNTSIKTEEKECSGNNKIVSSKDNEFSICVPGGWTLVNDTEINSMRVSPPFDIDENKQPVIKNDVSGGSDGTRDQFVIFTADTSYQGWTDKTAEKSTFKLNDGTKGTVYFMLHTKDSGEGPGPVKGEYDYEYLFEKNGKYVHAVYTVMPGTETKVDIVESVLKTLQIN